MSLSSVIISVSWSPSVAVAREEGMDSTIE
jgi:hypothetical protein